MPGYHIHIKGCVQGVGFRPFVYRLASEFKLTGWVSNGQDGVHIIVNASPDVIQNFYQRSLKECPAEAVPTSHTIHEVETTAFSTFEIIASESSGGVDMAIPPDFGMCDRCLAELEDSGNRRYEYAFITCTNCGPRYSIATSLPYDRENTSMATFNMCLTCGNEYDDPLDIRYYSQTNSCKTCGISIGLWNRYGEILGCNEDKLGQLDHFLKTGHIIAVKGVGGYLLMCDATQETVITRLRLRKHRPDKPFAVLYPNRQVLEQDVLLTQDQLRLLGTAWAPIVIAPLKGTLPSGLCVQEVAPQLSHLGVMLPYAPLLWLLAEKFGKPLVATSANLSGSPIVYQDDQAVEELFQFADLVLTHDRTIVTPQDDSVVRFLPNESDQIIIRRSRGVAPNYYYRQEVNTSKNILALGAEMKGGFAVNVGKNLYVSQYLGDLASYDAQLSYRSTLDHFLRLTQVTPDVIITDAHPNYFTTALGKELSGRWQIPQYQVQHHRAHFLSVLADNDLISSEGRTLGVIWDGTGFGEDGYIWGGEFFNYEHGEITRIQHFENFPIISGDQMAKLPKLSALAITRGHPLLKTNFRNNEWDYYKKACRQLSGYATSSVGRLFDAVSSILGLLHVSTYEGQAALLLEECALDFYQKENWAKVKGYRFELKNSGISLDLMLSEMIEKLNSGVSTGKLAARFHQTLVNIIDNNASLGNYKKIAFSGGVFQNALLGGLIKSQLRDKYELLFHKQLSPNDENISLGQWMHYYKQATRDDNLMTIKTDIACV